MQVAQSLFNKGDTKLLKGYFLNPELSQDLDFEIRSVAPGQNMTQEQFDRYQERLEKVKSNTLGQISDLKTSSQAAFRSACLRGTQNSAGDEFVNKSLHNPIRYNTDLFYRAKNKQTSMDEKILAAHGLTKKPSPKSDFDLQFQSRPPLLNTFLDDSDPVEKDIHRLKQGQQWIQNRHNITVDNYKRYHNQSLTSYESSFVSELKASRKASMSASKKE